MSLEITFLQVIQSMATSSAVATACAIFCARYLVFLNVLVLAFLWKKSKLGPHAVGEALWAGGIAILLTTGLSWLIVRPRPFASADHVARLIPEPWNMSFPSGHTSVAFAVAAIILSVDRRLGAVAFAIAVLVAFGRMAVGVHYPTDILGGLVIAAIAYGLVKKIHSEVWNRRLSV